LDFIIDMFMHLITKHQNASTKFQINSKFEISMTETSDLCTQLYLAVYDL